MIGRFDRSLYVGRMIEYLSLPELLSPAFVDAIAMDMLVKLLCAGPGRGKRGYKIRTVV